MATKKGFIDFILFCKKHLKQDCIFVGSLSDYFLVNHDLSLVNDFDVVIEKHSPEFVQTLPGISNWRWQGDLRYLGEDEGVQNVYKSNLEIDNDTYEVDWIFGKTINTPHTEVTVQYQGSSIRISSKQHRIQLLRNTYENTNQVQWYIDKNKERYDKYTVIL